MGNLLFMSDDKSCNRNDGIDLLRFICCIVVVLIHTAYTDQLRLFIKWISPVPIFFVISGYYSFGINEEKILKRIKKISAYLLSAVSLYFIYNIIKAAINNNFADYLSNTVVTKKNVFEILIMNDFKCVQGTHLWYLPVLIQCYLILLLLIKFRKEKNILYVFKYLPAMFGVFYVVRMTDGFAGRSLGGLFFTGNIQLFLLGLYLAYRKESVEKIKIRTLLIIVSICVMYSYGLFNWILHDGTLGFVIYLLEIVSYFLLALKVKHVKNPLLSLLAFVGRECSLYIYIIHIMVFFIIEDIFKRFGLFNNRDLITLVTILCSIIISCVIVYNRNLVRRNKK